MVLSESGTAVAQRSPRIACRVPISARWNRRWSLANSRQWSLVFGVDERSWCRLSSATLHDPRRQRGRRTRSSATTAARLAPRARVAHKHERESHTRQARLLLGLIAVDRPRSLYAARLMIRRSLSGWTGNGDRVTAWPGDGGQDDPADGPCAGDPHPRHDRELVHTAHHPQRVAAGMPASMVL
jgi:hypothetical protein